MDEINLKALAKINLGLDVLGKREDGYHEVRMVMQTIHLYDRVDIKNTISAYSCGNQSVLSAGECG